MVFELGLMGPYVMRPLYCLLISISSQVASSEEPPRPIFFDLQLAPQLEVLGVGFLPIPFNPLTPSLPGARPKIGLLAGGYQPNPFWAELGPANSFKYR